MWNNEKVMAFVQGDVFRINQISDLAKEKGLYGRHFLIQKVDEGVWHVHYIATDIHLFDLSLMIFA